MQISLDSYIEMLYQNALYNFKEHVEMLYIQAKSKVSEELIYFKNRLTKDVLKKRWFNQNIMKVKKKTNPLKMETSCNRISKNFKQMMKNKKGILYKFFKKDKSHKYQLEEKKI
jgi:hypothetical protein